MYIFHNLQPKDDSLAKTMIKTPMRILDFEAKKLLSIDYLNDDSTGNVRGDEEAKKETILP